MASPRQTLALALGFIVGTTSVQAADIAAPRWEIGEICASSSLGAKCPAIESQNRRTLLNRWEALSDADRKSCEDTVSSSGAKSYARLLACLDERQMKMLDQSSAPGSASAAKHL